MTAARATLGCTRWRRRAAQDGAASTTLIWGSGCLAHGRIARGSESGGMLWRDCHSSPPPPEEGVKESTFTPAALQLAEQPGAFVLAAIRLRLSNSRRRRRWD